MPRQSIAQKYQKRIRRIAAEDRTLRSKVRGLLRAGLQQATETQLYERTPLPVSRRLFRSIFTKSGKNSISVGYKGSVAPHNSIRLKKKGRSKMGGHDMTMEPAEFIEVAVGDKIARAGKGALHRVIGD